MLHSLITWVSFDCKTFKRAFMENWLQFTTWRNLIQLNRSLKNVIVYVLSIPEYYEYYPEYIPPYYVLMINKYQHVCFFCLKWYWTLNYEAVWERGAWDDLPKLLSAQHSIHFKWNLNLRLQLSRCHSRIMNDIITKDVNCDPNPNLLQHWLWSKFKQVLTFSVLKQNHRNCQNCYLRMSIFVSYLVPCLETLPLRGKQTFTSHPLCSQPFSAKYCQKTISSLHWCISKFAGRVESWLSNTGFMFKMLQVEMSKWVTLSRSSSSSFR